MDGAGSQHGVVLEVIATEQLLVSFPWVDPGFVGPEAYTIYVAVCKEKNTKLRI
jgi:hypothetical protein